MRGPPTEPAQQLERFCLHTLMPCTHASLCIQGPGGHCRALPSVEEGVQQPDSGPSSPAHIHMAAEARGAPGSQSPGCSPSHLGAECRQDTRVVACAAPTRVAGLQLPTGQDPQSPGAGLGHSRCSVRKPVQLRVGPTLRPPQTSPPRSSTSQLTAQKPHRSADCHTAMSSPCWTPLSAHPDPSS